MSQVGEQNSEAQALCLILISVSISACNFLYFDTENRHYGETKMNARSSRSHTIFRMVIYPGGGSACSVLFPPSLNENQGWGILIELDLSSCH